LKKIIFPALLILITGCGSAVKRPQLPSVISEEEASILYRQYRVTEKGSYFFKRYNFNGTGYRGPELFSLFESPYIKEETASAFDRFSIYNISAITGALAGGFSLGFNFGNMAVEKKTHTWVWITGGTGTAAMFLFQYLAERAASDAFARYNLDVKIKLGLAPEGITKTSPHEKNTAAMLGSPAGFQTLLGLSMRF